MLGTPRRQRAGSSWGRGHHILLIRLDRRQLWRLCVRIVRRNLRRATPHGVCYGATSARKSPTTSRSISGAAPHPLLMYVRVCNRVRMRLEFYRRLCPDHAVYFPLCTIISRTLVAAHRGRRPTSALRASCQAACSDSRTVSIVFRLKGVVKLWTHTVPKKAADGNRSFFCHESIPCEFAKKCHRMAIVICRSVVVH